MADVFVGLGSNIGDPASNLREATERLARDMVIQKVSSAYWTEPVGLREQPFFLNAVVRARTELAPREALAVLKRIEGAMGRQREVPLGPRIIDLDLLLYDDLELDEPGITLPHPRMDDRRFVLAPLAEIAPDVRLGPGGPTAAERLAALPEAESVERVALEGWPPHLRG
ncbi:MAG TPA: 2-amino-4-hydroxy-6-hydroxymethyldihydropteridine diphosphokinase [Longimicrobiales bacterium]|nr:2-amino-4-hydroxy-6-hydroxymethyldihydropteridine diphosphokinase [Longimicrobiales bacterium]